MARRPVGPTTQRVPAASPFYEDRVALIGGYNGLFDRLVLCELGGSIVERPSTWQPVLPGGDVLPAGIWMAARGRYVHVLSSNTWFRLDMAELEL